LREEGERGVGIPLKITIPLLKMGKGRRKIKAL